MTVQTEVTVRPGVGMLALFPSMNYKPWYAMSEFIDNALQSWRANSPLLKASHGGQFTLQIDVSFDRDQNTIRITDNAAGIAGSDIGRAFTPATPPADRSGLSQFGIGMKSAGCWYAKRFTVETTALGEGVSRRVVFDVPKIVDSGEESIGVEEFRAEETEHGTTLTLENLNQPIPTGRTLGKIRDFLRSIYRDYLRDPDIELVVGGLLLRPLDPEILEAPRWDYLSGDSLRWRKQILIRLESGKVISGWAAIRKKGKVSEAGLALMYRGKVVQGAGAAIGETGDAYKPRIVFGDGNSYASQRIIGELDVSALRVTHSKDSILWDENEEDEFHDLLRHQMDAEPMPLLRMASNYRATERGKSINRTIERAIDSVAAAVEQTLVANEPTTGLAAEDIDAQAFGGDHESPELARDIFYAVELAGGQQFRISVVDTPSDPRWLRVYRDEDVYVASMNRAHRFSESYADLPGMDIEPILRLATAMAIADIRFRSSGLGNPRFYLHVVNELLNGPLSERQ